MASFLPFFPLHFSFLFLVSHAQSFSYSPASLVLRVTKDDSTLQYLTSLSYGTPLVPSKLVLDLGGSSIWVDCASRSVPSSSIQTIPRRSILCLTAKTQEFESQTWLSSPTNPADQDKACQIFLENSITGRRGREGGLVEDLVSLQLTEESKAGMIKTFSHLHLLFTCSPALLLNGLASDAKGMVGLGRTRSSLASQILTSYNTQRRFSLCLSSSTGVVLFGNMAFESQAKAEIFRSLTFTPLITSQNQRYPSLEYFINVNSIKINGKHLSLNKSSPSKDQEGNGIGGTQLSSIVPYTTMESSIYATFKKAFMKAALSMNMTRVASAAPFELCFSSRGNDSSQVGPDVPVIELVLQSEMVKWRIYGRNSMVQVSSEVMCLAFVDGGLNPRNGIVIGGYQLEDVIVQFDLDTSIVGFSSSLLMRNATCSDFKFGYMPSESV